MRHKQRATFASTTRVGLIQVLGLLGTSMTIERRARAVSPDGESVSVRFIISEPSVTARGDLYVSLCLLGLDQFSQTVEGADPWQAVDLAMLTARERLEHYSDLGWKFYWEKEEPEDQEFEMSPEEMHSDNGEA